MWNEYMQQVILISNLNLVYAGPCAHVVWGEDLGHLVAGIMGSNATSGLDVCPLFSYVVLSQAEALGQADHSKKSCIVCTTNKCVMAKAWPLQ
jgi:hypothetical protein